ncbi:MAG: hypothetical protein JWM59_2562 [Verrucomicrobiales bacterium]|nr:hypothetical protein [Verrucomicrobiales bacterium]
MINIRFPVLVLGVVLSGPAAWGQTLSDALDTPDRTWTPAGAVTALNDPALAHDGVDAVRLEVFRSPETGVFESSISTELAVPSVVEFWHRSRDLDAVTVLGINNIPSGNSSVWKLHQTVAPAGKLEISNKGEPGAGPLYLDSVRVRPAALVSLAEALDWTAPVEQGVSNNPGTVFGVNEGWLAPDGADAVYFNQTDTYIQTTVTGPALLSYRSRDARENAGTEALASISPERAPFPEFTVGDRTWFQAPAAGVMYFKTRYGATAPVVMDALETVPPVPAGEALDTAVAGVTLSGYAAGTSRVPAGASDGDAVLCLEDRAPGDPVAGPNSGQVSVTVAGPALVRFEYLGAGSCTSDGIWMLPLDSALQPQSMNSTAWRTVEIPVYQASQVVGWTGNLWINAVSAHPLPPGLSPGTLLDAPDVVPEFPIPARVMPQFSPVAKNGQEQGLVVAPVPTPAGTVPVIRLPFQGPSVVSLWVSSNSSLARLRIDGGPWQAKPPVIWYLNDPFMAVVPTAGAHFLEVSGPAFMDQFRVVPLEELPLAEALGAPELVFTTSPGTPWKGYKVPEGLDKRDNRAATGGQHTVEADPWIETTVNGPGVLGFKIRWHSVVSAGFPGGTGDFPPRMSIDGATAEAVTGGPGGAPSEFFVGAGPHTVRWIQKGSRAGEPPSTMVWMDGVSFKPGTIPASEALDTPGRSWTLGGSGGEALPLAMATGSPDGVDSVRMQSTSAGGSGWVETVVNLPAYISFSGSNLVITNGAGEVIFNQGTAAASSFQREIKGVGPAQLRFSHTPGQPGVLDKVMIFESAGRIASTAVLSPSGSVWKRLDEKPWSVLENPWTGEAVFQAGNPFWIEGTVMGPCMLGIGQEMTLPDHGNRKVFNGLISYAGPQRVLMARRNGNPASAQFLVTDGYRPALDMTEAMGASGITWTTGGDAVWICVGNRLAYSPTLWPGETSWMEAAVTGPGVLSWRLPPAGSFSLTMKTDVLCDGVALPDAAVSWLHLTAGPHRVRWQVSMPVYATRNLEEFRQLREVDFRPMATGSVPELLGSNLNFHEEAPVGPISSDPVEPWPAATGWRAGSDPATGVPTLEADYGAGTLTALPPVPGTVTSQLKMERNGPLGFTVINTLPAAAAPFPWTAWTTSRPPVWPLAEGCRTSAAAVVFTPFTPVSVAEALDQPGLEWTAESNPPGLWKALTGVPLSENTDPDGLYLYGMAMGDTAWLETTVTGPLEVSTQFGTSGRVEPGLRILLDGVHAADATRAGSVLRVPAGSHRVRWEVAPATPILGGSYAVIRSITTAPGAVLPDFNALLDAPNLKWSLTGTIPAPVAGTDAHDGLDALSLGSGTGYTVLTAGMEGPGILSFWMKGSPSLGEPILAGQTVPFPRTTPPTPLTAWRKITLPVPVGMQTCHFRGPGILDEFTWQPLPALTPEEALDTPPGVTVTMPNPNLYGAAAWPEFSDDGADSLMMMPGQARRLEVKVPPLSSLSLRVRAVFGTGTFGFQDLDSQPTSTTWTTRTFSTQADAGITTVYLRASLAPVLIDRLTVTTPPGTGVGYFPWADGHGLATARNQPLDDPDGDGWSNLLEYSLGGNPALGGDVKPGTETVPGAPETVFWTDPLSGLVYLEVRYWKRTSQTATVETAQNPDSARLLGDAAGWSSSPLPGTVTTPGPEGWSRVVWRSPEPATAGGRIFVRVRYSAL